MSQLLQRWLPWSSKTPRWCSYTEIWPSIYVECKEERESKSIETRMKSHLFCINNTHRLFREKARSLLQNWRSSRSSKNEKRTNTIISRSWNAGNAIRSMRLRYWMQHLIPKKVDSIFHGVTNLNLIIGENPRWWRHAVSFFGSSIRDQGMGRGDPALRAHPHFGAICVRHHT